MKPTVVQVFTVPQSLPFIDGQPAFLADRGYSVHMVSSERAEVETFARLQNATYDVVPFVRAISPWRDGVCLVLCCRLFRRLRPAIVHGNTPKAGLISLVAAWLTAVPVRIYEIHGLPLESRKGLSRWLLTKVEWLACRAATQVLAVSPSVRDRVIARKITAAAKIQVPHYGSCNGVEAVYQFNPARLDDDLLTDLRRKLALHHPTIGFVGRLTGDKGIRELLAAWQHLRNDDSDVILLLIGAPEADFLADAALRVLIAQDKRIRLIGPVTDLVYYYPLMDFIVLPTYREGLPNVVLEAAAMEVPALVSRVTGTVDAVVEGRTGIFCEPQSVSSLLEQLRWYLDHPLTVREHGKNARWRVLNRFVPTDIWTAKWQVYEHALAKAGMSKMRGERTSAL